MAIRRLVSILLLICAATAVAGHSAWAGKADPRPERPSGTTPDIVLIVLDRVGFAGLGSFGGRADTPHLDRLAREGLRYSAFNAALSGAATRAALLTGRDPGAAGDIPPEVPLLPVLLKPLGYVSFALGQWELAPPRARSAALGPFEPWPTGRGFAHFYGWLSDSTDSWYPELYRDTTPVDPPRTPEQGYHVNEDLVDHAIRYIDDLRSADPARPFFLYLALGAAGPFQQAPKAYRELYRGRFAEGWDRERDMVFERQKVLGLVPPETRPPPRDPDIPDWARLDPDRRALFQAYMENRAGGLTHADAQIGRLLEHLRAAGRLDHTLIMVVSDGGAGAEGGRDGALNRVALLNGIRPALGETLARRDSIGDPGTAPVPPWGWASAGNLPFRGGEGDPDNGGLRVPLIVWTPGIANPGSLRRHWLYATDLVPTVLEVLRLPPPPLHGGSFARTFTTAEAPPVHATQYWAGGSRRAVYHRGWKAVATDARPGDFASGTWRLYHLDADFAEAEDLAAARPDKLAELTARFWAEAGRHGTLPGESQSPIQAASTREAALSGTRSRQYRFFPGLSPLPEPLAPDLFGKAYSVTAHLDRSAGAADGVLAAQGGAGGGWALLVRDSRPVFVYRSPAGPLYTLRGTDSLPMGRVRVRYRFLPSRNHAGRGELFVDDRKLGETRIEQPATVTFGTEPFEVGRDGRSPVGSDYRPPFPYTGVIERVEVETDE